MSLRSKLVPSLSIARCRASPWATRAIEFQRLPTDSLQQRTAYRFFDFYQLADKEAIKKERARLQQLYQMDSDLNDNIRVLFAIASTVIQLALQLWSYNHDSSDKRQKTDAIQSMQALAIQDRQDNTLDILTTNYFAIMHALTNSKLSISEWNGKVQGEWYIKPRSLHWWNHYIFQCSEDELNRGYFADISELKKHGGKVGFANKTLIPAIAAKRFPPLVVEFTDGRKLTLPLNEGNSADNMHSISKLANPNATLICLSFRANSQAMIESWSSPFIETFKNTTGVQLYEVSFIDSWLLSLNPIKRLLLRTMRKSEIINGGQGLQRYVVYSFGDHYYLRKDLNILNLLTGYILLVDKKGRIRWQGFGLASDAEVSSMLSCSSWLLEEQRSSF